MADHIPPSSLNPTINSIRTTGDTDIFPSIPATPRSHKSRGGTVNIVDLRPAIAIEMDNELVQCSIDAFMEAYFSFLPSNEVVERIVWELSDSSYQETTGDDLSDGESSEKASEEKTSAKDTTEKVASPKSSFVDKDGEIPTGTSLMLCHGNRMLIREFPRAPVAGDGSERVVYAPLGQIADAIGQIPKDIVGRTRNEFSYRDVSSKRIDSKIKGSDNKIDACFMRGSSSGELQTSNIAVVVEQKLSVDDRVKNSLQAVSANVQIMNDDVRRVRTFGITIESDQVTLWHHSRSHSAMSEPFSFVDHPKLLIKIFASFLFATEEELGYDPRIEVDSRKRFIFKIPVEDKSKEEYNLYRTEESISEYRSNNITGRMARVYRVVKYNSATKRWGTKKFVLKDVWLDKSAQTERQLQTAILGDIKTFWDREDSLIDPDLLPFKKANPGIVGNGSYKNLFLHIEDDYVGQTSKPLPSGYRPVRGTLLKAEVKDKSPPPTTSPEQSNTSSRKPADFERSATTHTVPPASHHLHQEFERTYVPKRQYRVVFQEVCRTLGQLETLGEVMNVLGQTLIALQMLLCAGWVHRDISSGNILAFRKNLDVEGPWQVKLADLEYAQKFPPPPNYEPALDPKTGTPYFMPYEIMTGKTLYAPGYGKALNRSSTQTQTQQHPTLALQKVLAARLAREEGKPLTTVTHNFQHDLESVWWLILWNITGRIKHESSQTFAKTVFQHTTTIPPMREHYFIRPIDSKLLTVLNPLIRGFVDPMEALRLEMYDQYIIRGENGTVSNAGAYAGIHQFFMSMFEAFDATRSKWSGIVLQDHSAGRKRGRPDADAGPTAQAGDDTGRKSKQSKRSHSQMVNKDGNETGSNSKQTKRTRSQASKRRDA